MLPNQEAITALDFEFQRVAVACKSKIGVPYTRTVAVGMPAIPEFIVNSVAYLYPDEASANAGARVGGCGFLVGFPSQVEDVKHVYLVTNYHVVMGSEGGLGNPVVRLNTQDGKADVIPFDVADWTFLPGAGDVAAIRLPVDKTLHRYNPVGLSVLLTETLARDKICIGEDVFMVGRFVDHDGGLTNMPAARFGHISMLPSHLRGMQNTARDVNYYCLDMHSRSGFSGSPVYVYRTAGTDLSLAIKGELPELHSPILGLLGIHVGQFPERLKTENGSSVTGWSGMTYVLPAWQITRLLESESLVNERQRAEAQSGKRLRPVPESAKEAPAAGFDDVLKRMLSTPPAHKVKAKLAAKSAQKKPAK